MSKRVAIVGTFPTWKQTPWNDPTLEIWGLNDAYTLGFPRAERWFELHPIQKFHYRKRDQKAVYADQIPHGFYVRPEGHLEWLREHAKTIPVYLQQVPPPDWPQNARRFPLEEVEAVFGTYWASGPAYEIGLAMLEGVTELHIYGIHLATEHEYREQRPNFEHLLGRFLGRHFTSKTEGDVRIYQGDGVKLVLPKSCPILTHGWKYGYEPKPQGHPAKPQLMRVRQEKAQIANRLVEWPRWKSKAPALDRLRRLQAMEADLTMQMQQAQMAQAFPPLIAR